MSALSRFTEPVRTWFEETLGEPTAPQAQGWPSIQAGRHTLILSPTGSGKTLAAFLWGIDRIFAELAGGHTKRGVRLLYVSPLKALNNDIERNLRRPLEGAREVAERLGRPLPEVEVAVRTGDTPNRVRQRMTKKPPHILITTPESLYLMLSGSRAREIFRSVRTVIVDEIHTVAGNKRGVHLALTLERLTHLVDGPLQRIGLSATQRPLEEVARFLGGQEWQTGPGGERRLVPREVTIVDAGRQKDLDLQIVTPVADFAELGGSIWPSIVQQTAGLIAEHQTTLVFTNGRRLAERIAANLSEELGHGTIRAHHGSMATYARMEMESDLKAGRLPALVGTSSLELGIDIGSVDLVVQLQSPKGVARGLQRVGRAGHLVGQTSVGRIYPTHREDLVESAAVAGGMLRGEVEMTRVPENCLDVLAQQVVAAVSVESWSESELYDLCRQSYPYRDLPLSAYQEVLSMLGGKYPKEIYRELRPRLDWDRPAGILNPLPGSAYLARINGGTITDRGAFGVYLSDGKTKIGEVDEEFVYERRDGDIFTLGSQTWRLIHIADDRIIVEGAASGSAMAPFWHGDTPWRPYELGLEVGRFRRLLAERLRRPDVIEWLERDYACDENSARALLSYVGSQIEAVGTISSDRTVVVELFRDPLGDPRLVIHSPFGGRINAAWALALKSAFHERLRTAPEVMTNDDGILLRFPEADQDPPVDLITDMAPAEARERILAELPDSAVFGAQFRQNAARALLMPRGRHGRRTPFWLQRLRAKDLLATTRQFDSFPIIIETYRDCLRDVLDLDNLLDLLGNIREGRIRVVPVERATPSPVAMGLLWSFENQYIYEWDAPKAERQYRALAINRDLLTELLKDASLADLLRPEAIAELEAYLQRTAPGRRARSPEELAVILQELGDLSTDELLARCEEAGPSWLQLLAAQGRITEIDIPTAHGASRRWVLTEEADTYRQAFASSPSDSPPPQGAAEPIAMAPDSAAPQGEGSGVGSALGEGQGEGLKDSPPRDGEGLGVGSSSVEVSGAGSGQEDMARSRRRLLRRLLLTHGPLDLEQIRARYDLPAGWLAEVLREWVEAREAARGHMVSGDPAEQWCDRQNLEQAHRRTLQFLRREIQPVPLTAYAGFLARWQHAHPEERLPRGDGLRRALQQLRAVPAPALLWERDLLPARVEGFRADDLEALCQSGEVVWVASGSGKASHLRARILFRSEGSLYLPPPPDDDARELSEPAEKVLAFLRSEGACFTADLERGTRLRGDDLAAALLELVSAGLVANDSLRALRELVRYRPGTELRRPLSSLEADLAARLTSARPQRPGRMREARRRAARHLAAAPRWVGRWSLVHRMGIWGGDVPAEEALDRQARQLLARYGVLTRDCLGREDGPFPWGSLYSYLQILEMRGEVRRGYFVQGLAGAQFALPEAVERLRAQHTAAPGDEPPVVVLNAWDPAAALAAQLVADLRTPAGEPITLHRRPSTYIAQRDGRPLLIAERRGRSLSTPAGVADGEVLAALRACFAELSRRTARSIPSIVFDSVAHSC